jgi:hypothetical protein
MMKAIVTHEFDGRPDGEALARLIPAGEVIFGELAQVAIAAGDAELIEEAIVEVDDADEGPDLHKMTRTDLDTLAAERGVDIKKAKNKADVIGLLKAAEEKSAV